MIEQIEELSKQLHHLAERFDAACKAGDGFQAFETIGKINQLMRELRRTASAIHNNEEIDRERQRHHYEQLFRGTQNDRQST